MTMFESGPAYGGQAEFQEWELMGETGEAEANEYELAHELLEITTEAELEQFLGKLVSGVIKGAGTFAKSDAGKALGGVLKGVAKAALPIAGAALGSFVPVVGTAIGGQLGSMASSLLEVGEAELLGEEEAEVEGARRFVRFAQSAARNASMAPPNAPPKAVARSAAVSAARRHAPALLRPAAQTSQAQTWRNRRAQRPGSPRPRPRAYPAPTAWRPDWIDWGTVSQPPSSWDPSGGDGHASVPPAGAGPPSGGPSEPTDPGDAFAGASQDEAPWYEFR